MMSDNHKMTNRTRIPKRPGEPAHNSAGNPESSETSGTEGENDDSELTFRQQALLPAIALSNSIAEAARDSGIPESTLRRWLEDPSFKEELARVRQESHSIARHQIQTAMPLGISVIVELAIKDPDSALRLRAARCLVDYGLKLGDVDNISDELQDLREAARATQDEPPLA